MKEFTPTIEQAKNIKYDYENCDGRCHECTADVNDGLYEIPYSFRCTYVYKQACKVLERKGETK